MAIPGFVNAHYHSLAARDIAQVDTAPYLRQRLPPDIRAVVTGVRYALYHMGAAHAQSLAQDIGLDRFIRCLC